ncbi:glycosyltransferase family 4 protein [Ilumatobacter sp.]|uniref:glycosyltransferase family 4 protein n=2 Tax=Ilumatobacter sp. TaxID=1967498 RepID=UPI00375099CE
MRVAVDTGPLHGHRTGIGNAVAWTLDALAHQADLELLPYVLSTRAKITAPERRLPIPAAWAHRLWMHRSPSLDRLLGRPDIVHGTNYVVPPTRCPQLISVYDCWFLEHPNDVSDDATRAAQLLRRAVGRGAHLVTCSAATSAQARVLLDTDRVHTVLLGPPPDRAADDHRDDGRNESGGNWPADLSTLDRGSPFILSLGTVERRKNVPQTVRAFARVADEHSTVNLVIAGAPGNDQAAVDQAINQLPDAVQRRVVRLGSINDELKSRLLFNASALAYPSLDEGFGFPLLEAQQAGLPVVASTAGSIPEVAGSAALYSAPTDVDALAANLHLAITSETVRTKLISQGHRNLERFSWASTADQLTQLYIDIVNGAAS